MEKEGEKGMRRVGEENDAKRGPVCEKRRREDPINSQGKYFGPIVTLQTGMNSIIRVYLFPAISENKTKQLLTGRSI